MVPQAQRHPGRAAEGPLPDVATANAPITIIPTTIVPIHATSGGLPVAPTDGPAAGTVDARARP